MRSPFSKNDGSRQQWAGGFQDSRCGCWKEDATARCAFLTRNAQSHGHATAEASSPWTPRIFRRGVCPRQTRSSLDLKDATGRSIDWHNPLVRPNFGDAKTKMQEQWNCAIDFAFNPHVLDPKWVRALDSWSRVRSGKRPAHGSARCCGSWKSSKAARAPGRPRAAV